MKISVKFQTILFLLILIPTLQYSGLERRQKVFNQTVAELTIKNNCFWNNELIDHFNQKLIQNKLGVRQNRIEYKLETDQFLDNFVYKKIWVNEYDIKYKICIREETYENTHIPKKTVQISNLSVSHTFQQYPYLRDHLSHFKITQMLSYLPYSLKSELLMARYTIFENQIYLETYPSENFIWNLMNKIILDLNTQLPNMDFIIYSRSQVHQRFIFEAMDYSFGNSHTTFDGNVELAKKIIIQLPAFMMSKDLKGKLEFNKLLIVDCEIAQFPWNDALRDIRVGQSKYAWDNKVEKGFWRGDATGKPYDYIDFWIDIPKYFPRLNLVDISQKNPELLNAKFTNDEMMSPQKLKAHNISVAIDVPSPIEDFLKFKYIINVDGWSANWLTLAWMLGSNSVVLKQQTTKVQWFYDQIKSNIHYIPLRQDLSDVVDQIKALRQNDQFAKNVSRAAQQYVRNKMQPSKIKLKLKSILQEYAEIQQLQLGLYWKITMKYKTALKIIQIIVLLILGMIALWKVYKIYPQVTSYLSKTFIWKGINQYFNNQRQGYDQVAQS